ncbi:ABC transporter permease [Zhaonella formicivorans]|uniref:ABC transporter permease n=1 Tax=Zhaonella formicivorans TaxID=2528593 RepID=UPI0010DF6A5C
MELFWQGITQALHSEVWQVTSLSLQISGVATLLSLLLGLPLGITLALKNFPGRKIIISIVNTGMGMPPVLIGLVISLLLWRSGPLGYLHLMYTPWAIIIAQAVIAFPLITALTVTALQQVNPKLRLQLLALGASPWQLVMTLLREARLSLLAAVIAGFGAAISEVGAAMMVGGNIKGQTRVLTTTIALAVSRGDFNLALVLGFVLLGLAFAVTFFLTSVQQRGHSDEYHS